jgi:hypothetical protein
MNPSVLQIVGALLFGLALLHTFSSSAFEKLAHRPSPHAGFWHLLAEVMALRARFAELVRSLDIVADDYATDTVPQSSNEPVIDGASVDEPPF